MNKMEKRNEFATEYLKRKCRKQYRENIRIIKGCFFGLSILSLGLVGITFICVLLEKVIF
jgi:hypothetical protein